MTFDAQPDRTFSLLFLILFSSIGLWALDGAAAGPSAMDLLNNERRLEVGDRFEYRVLEERESAVSLFINGTGRIKIPLLGEVEALGHTEYSLAQAIKDALEKSYFYRATVMLQRTVDRRVDGRAYVLGAVRTPGQMDLPADDVVRLSSLVLRAGGFTPEADRQAVTLVRRDESTDEEVRTTHDVASMLERGDFSQDPVVTPNDLVLVPEKARTDRTVYVLGAVNRPGEIEVASIDFTLSQAILAAGGFSRFARTNRVRLVRTRDDGSLTTENHNMDAVFERGDRTMDPPVRSGDVIRVDERFINF